MNIDPCLRDVDPTLAVQVGVVWVLFFSMIGWSFFATEITVYNDCKTFYQCIMLGMDKGTRGLIQGVIVDAFSELRAEGDARRDNSAQ